MLRAAHARARERFWKLDGASERLTIDIDPTLITSHSEKERAAGNYKGGYAFHPLQAYADETREALGAMLRPGNAGANTAADHVTVIDRAIAQVPAEYIESLEILVRADSAGATHELADHCYEGNMRFSFGYELTESIRAAILETPEDAWVVALDQDDSERENGEVAEITKSVELSFWSEGSRLIVRRERPHPGAQLFFTDHGGYRFQAILTDQTDQNIDVVERRHRQRVRVEDRIRDDKDTGLAKFPFKEFAMNEVWLEIQRSPVSCRYGIRTSRMTVVVVNVVKSFSSACSARGLVVALERGLHLRARFGGYCRRSGSGGCGGGYLEAGGDREFCGLGGRHAVVDVAHHHARASSTRE